MSSGRIGPSTDEQVVTQEYMQKYGIDNVRGGPWCKISLSESEKELITHMNQSNSDTCYKCGKQGHFASNCRNKKTSTKPRTNACSRCGRDSHKADKCYATTDVDGDPLLGEEVWACSYCQKEFDSEKGASYHERFRCRRKKSAGQSLRQKVARAKKDHAQRKRERGQRREQRQGHTTVITLYANGSRIADGPFRPKGTPSGDLLLEDIAAGQCPRELVKGGEPVSVSVVDRRGEYYCGALPYSGSEAGLEACRCHLDGSIACNFCA